MLVEKPVDLSLRRPKGPTYQKAHKLIQTLYLSSIDCHLLIIRSVKETITLLSKMFDDYHLQIKRRANMSLVGFPKDLGLIMYKFKGALAIPCKVESFLLPNSQLSILKLLKYQLLLISTTLSKIHEFFSNNTPTKESAQAITLIPSPSQATVIRLQNQLLEATKKDI